MKPLYNMPAEWEDHVATLISWPIQDSMIWPKNYREVCRGYSQVIRAIASFEPVYVLADDDTKAIASNYIFENIQTDVGSNIHWLNIAHDDAWLRDNGPTYVRELGSGNVMGISWEFNAWGGKYPEFESDNAVARKVNQLLEYPTINADLVLEGGSIHVDGEGTLLTTKECLLNPNRNPNLNQTDIECLLKEYLGIHHIIWLDQGLFGDETDGHIDNIACFARPQTIVVQTRQDKSDPNYEISQKALTVLNHSVDSQGNAIKVVEIEGPPARFYQGQRLTLSYLNFYLVNGGVILPVFGEDAVDYDQKAIETLENLFPERKIVPVDGMALIKEGGNVHCITQQIPRREKKDA